MDVPLIMQLPDELLSHILDNLPDLPLDRRHALLSLTLANHKLRSLARERLLTRPFIHICKVGLLVKIYVQESEIANRVQTLEIRSGDDLGSYNFATSKAIKRHKTGSFEKACTRMVEDSHIASEAIWADDLRDDAPEAYLGILFSMLLLLNRLFLGANNLRELSPSTLSSSTPRTQRVPRTKQT